MKECKNNCSLKSKEGISLIVLVITIVVALILITISVISVRSSIDNATLTTFANNMTQIQDATESYYITNNAFPVPDDAIEAKTKQDVLNMSGSANTTKLSEEFGLNGDSATNEFYEVNIYKLNISKTPYGNGANGSNDVLVVAYPTMHVYYLKGVQAKGNVYFSLSSKISESIVNLYGTNNVDTSTTEVISLAGMSVTREKNWTNTMPLTIKSDIAADESLYISLSGGAQKQVATSGTKYDRSFNLTDLFAANDILSGNGQLSIGDIDASKNYLEVIKKKGSDELGRIKVDLSKFETVAPTITNVTSSSYTNMNTVIFDVNDNLSNIKEIRYDYLTKIDNNGVEQNYYNGISSFDISYMKQKSKKVKDAVSGAMSINIPKNVNQVSIAVFDNAGNYILQGIRVSPIINIGTTINSATKDGFAVTTNTYSTNGISQIKFSYSLDGITYANDQIVAVNSNNLTTSRQVTYAGVDSSKAYLKIEITDNNSVVASRKTETKILAIKENLNSYEIPNKPILTAGMTAKKWNATTNAWDTVANPEMDTSWYNYANKEWANAQTADGSMWVWIPRYIYKMSTINWHTSNAGVIDVQFSKGTNDNWNSGVLGTINTASGADASNNTWTNEPAFTFGATELTGIWVAKFEASNNGGKIKVVPNVTSWRNITINDIFNDCRSMETDNTYGWGTSGTGIDTHMMKNTEWGSIAYLSSSKYGKTGEIWINPDSNYLTGRAGTSASADATTTTYAYDNTQYGVNSSSTGNVHGVYDLSGGAFEYLAAYVDNGSASLSTYGGALTATGTDPKYRDVYKKGSIDDRAPNYLASSEKKGDAVYETSSNGGDINGASSWYSDQSYIPRVDVPFFTRGGFNSSSSGAGVFSYTNYEVRAFVTLGFRPVLVLDSTL